MTSEHCSRRRIKATYAAAVEESASLRPRKTTTSSSPKIVVASTTKTNKVMILLSLAVMMCMSTVATAQQECSCAPREYVFKLDFSGTCPPTLPNPPNDYFGSGVSEYTCNIGDTPVDTRKQGPDRRYLDTQLTDLFPEIIISTQNVADDQTPVIVSSIQFIQSDESGQPIESSLQDVDKNDGDTIRFISSIVTKPEEIPYRITMVLRGLNADNEAIQNLFTIDFTNTCGVPTFNEGERIGWVIFVSFFSCSRVCGLLVAFLSRFSNNTILLICLCIG